MTGRGADGCTAAGDMAAAVWARVRAARRAGRTAFGEAGTALADRGGMGEMAAAGEMAGRGDSADMADRAEKPGNSGKAGRMAGKAGRMADKAGRGKEDLSVPGRAERVLPEGARGRGDMDLVLEDLGDPTSNRRRAAGMAACSSNSSSCLYYGIRRSNSRAWKSRGHCSRNIHLALAWNRILSCFAVSSDTDTSAGKIALCQGHNSCCPVPLYSGLAGRCKRMPSGVDKPPSEVILLFMIINRFMGG